MHPSGPGALFRAMQKLPPWRPFLRTDVRWDTQGLRGGSLTVFSGDGGGKICEVSETIKPPHLENPVAPLAFQIFYQDAKPDAKEPDKQQKGHRTTKYKLVGVVTEPNAGSAREDQNESNNRIEATFTVPAGGVASCIKLQ